MDDWSHPDFDIDGDMLEAIQQYVEVTPRAERLPVTAEIMRFKEEFGGTKN